MPRLGCRRRNGSGGNGMNILFVTADQWRGDCLGAAGHPSAVTPHLDRLAADGVRFARHHTQATPCGPARASLHTGLYAFNHRSITNGTPLDARHRTVAQLLRAAGRDPVLFGYTDTSADPRRYPADDPRLTSYEGVAPGYRVELQLPEHLGPWLDHLAARGYGRRDHVWDWYRGPLGAPAPWRAEDSETAFLADRFLDWHRHRRGPWTAHLSFIKPHPPLVEPAPYHALVDPARMPLPVPPAGPAHPWLEVHRNQPLGASWGALAGRLPRDLDAATWRTLRAVYLGAIAEVDHHLGRILGALERSGELDRTLVVVTADHAEMLGDQLMLGKAGFFPQAFHVPLVVRAPGGARGRTVEAFTEHVDIMPTLLEAAGLAAPLQGDGHSLWPFLRGDAPAGWRDATHWEHDFRDVEALTYERALDLPSDRCSLAVRLERRFAYVHFAGLPPLCFDHAADPGWTRDLAGDPAAAGIVRDLAQGMLDWRMRHAERRLTGAKLTACGVKGSFDPA
ncbi:MAG: alkaline phosphatase family protein [Geminicoccaceae bacterium]